MSGKRIFDFETKKAKLCGTGDVGICNTFCKYYGKCFGIRLAKSLTLRDVCTRYVPVTEYPVNAEPTITKIRLFYKGRGI